MFRYSLFQPMSKSNGLILPHDGFRRITSHLTHARQYQSLRCSMLSDHAPFVLPFAVCNKGSVNPYLVPWSQYYKQYEKVSLLTWNMMMRGKYNTDKKRFNNAFGVDESVDEYLSRVEKVVRNIGECVSRHPEVAMIFLQEAPVKPEHLTQMQDWFAKYLPEGFILNLDATEWGILTLTNQAIFPELNKLRTVYSGALSEMNTRKSTMVLPGLKTQFTNLHLPHDNPEEGLELVIGNLKRSLLTNIMNDERYGSFIFTGDWNLAADVITTAATRAVEHLFEPMIPIRCDVSVIASPAGHIKTDGSVVGVDCSLAVCYKVSRRDLSLVQEMLLPELETPIAGAAPRF